MDYKELYNLWKSNDYFDAADRKELCELKDEKDIEDRFYKELEFGTGGLRGIMGLGSNRMNKYNIRKASSGFADFLKDKYRDQICRGVAIAYDTRENSKDFALEAALSFAAKGIKVFLFSFYSATPLLSFAVRQLNCIGGVVITASHNPKEYNGYKAYDRNGCQLLDDDANKVIEYVNALPISSAEIISEQKAISEGLLEYIGEDILGKYSEAIIAAVPPLNPELRSNIKIAYTPLHGCGFISVAKVLKDAGYCFETVKEQANPDGSFPTVASPNPGNAASLEMLIKLGESINADIAVGSDPDADRAGLAIRKNERLEFLDGNSIGAFLMYYLCERNKGCLPEGSYFVTTIVSGELASVIAKDYGVDVLKVLTGFKYIGDYISRFTPELGKNYLFGCEESYGFLSGKYVRDKCAANAILLLCDACAYYKNKGLSLGEVMDIIHEKYGYYLDSLDSYKFPGKEGAEKMQQIIGRLRAAGASAFPGASDFKDYSEGLEGLPKSSVFKYFFKDGSWAAIRPSGTEPLIKVYYSTAAKEKAAAEASYEERKKITEDLLK